jgi:hypothetical protein
MDLDNNLKLVLGIVFAIVGIGILIVDRRSRGFGQRRQAGALLLVGGLVIAAVAHGLIRF